MKDLRLFSLMGGALILAWLLAPKATPPASVGDARCDHPDSRPASRPARRRCELQDVGPCHVDESFVPQRYVH